METCNLIQCLRLIFNVILTLFESYSDIYKNNGKHCFGGGNRVTTWFLFPIGTEETAQIVLFLCMCESDIYSTVEGVTAYMCLTWQIRCVIAVFPLLCPLAIEKDKVKVRGQSLLHSIGWSLSHDLWSSHAVTGEDIYVSVFQSEQRL